LRRVSLDSSQVSLFGQEGFSAEEGEGVNGSRDLFAAMAGERESDSGGRPYFCCIANCEAQIANCMKMKMIVYCDRLV
jgi:hypothetical protein